MGEKPQSSTAPFIRSMELLTLSGVLRAFCDIGSRTTCGCTSPLWLHLVIYVTNFRNEILDSSQAPLERCAAFHDFSDRRNQFL